MASKKRGKSLNCRSEEGMDDPVEMVFSPSEIWVLIRPDDLSHGGIQDRR